MTSVEVGVARRGAGMVGPPFLYDGAQVCGRRTGRTCIFLLVSFGAALSMIGLVLFTADLEMKTGMWAAGVVLIALGVMCLVWFTTLCCAARRAFYALPASHPARSKMPRPALATPRSSTYQLLPMTQTRAQATSTPQPAPTYTLPLPASHRQPRSAQSESYPTMPARGYSNRSKGYVAGQSGVQPSLYMWGSPIGNTSGYQGRIGQHTGYPPDPSVIDHQRPPNPLSAHTLGRPMPGPTGHYQWSYGMTLPAHGRMALRGQMADDSPPPYHAVVSDAGPSSPLTLLIPDTAPSSPPHP